jgi:hypothetical protein
MGLKKHSLDHGCADEAGEPWDADNTTAVMPVWELPFVERACVSRSTKEQVSHLSPPE